LQLNDDGYGDHHGEISFLYVLCDGFHVREPYRLIMHLKLNFVSLSFHLYGVSGHLFLYV
jgi:hypothetical protein